MKPVGIIGQIDELRRIGIPKKVCKAVGIEPKEPVEIYVEEDKIILKKHTERCVFCSETENLTDFKGKKICPVCKAELSQ